VTRWQRIGVAAALGLALLGCGQKGPLYLPDDVGEVVTRPMSTPGAAPAPAPPAPAGTSGTNGTTRDPATPAAAPAPAAPPAPADDATPRKPPADRAPSPSGP
jgi:predicted small lipoprotein YifL